MHYLRTSLQIKAELTNLKALFFIFPSVACSLDDFVYAPIGEIPLEKMKEIPTVGANSVGFLCLLREALLADWEPLP